MESSKSKFAENEEEILNYWDKKEIFQKTLAKKSPKGNFVFFEGPPTANGRPGIHHVLARSFKDVIPRFKTMQGFHVERKAGWDTHGLPVELQVEKELGISGKPDIEKYGIEAFNKKCKESVWLFQGEWEKLTKRIGFWLDMEHPYITYNNEYIESLWWILKKINDKGLLYKGYKVVPQCPRCGTALSSHEVAQGYKLVTDNSIYIKFKLKNQKNSYILSWTTTPWTLPGNVALAVGEKIEYVKVKVSTKRDENNKPIYENLILAKEIFNRWKLESKSSPISFGLYSVSGLSSGEQEELLKTPQVLEEFTGKDLIGLEYEPLFQGYLDPGDKKAWFVGQANFVSTVDGTGVVHTAVMYGEDDFNFGLENDLPFIHTVDENGKFLPSVKKWAGKFVKNKTVENEIIEDLRSRNLLLGEKGCEHDYPFCWRCDSPLLYYAKNSWFIKMSSLKNDLLKSNANINWVPDHIKAGRFGDWLENIKDWAISRQRYWGTPIPIWECDKCGGLDVIGSFEELEQKTGALPKDKDGNLDVHRPFIDNLTYSCSCGGQKKRILEVLDCWFDSGAMPFAQYHYPFENKNLIDKNQQFPAEFISEAIDQTRGWFYTLLAISTLLEKDEPYKNVICLGHIRDKEGKKMSKSKGNVVNPWMIIDKYGVDALRMHLYSLNQPGDPKNFDESDVKEVLQKVIMLTGNVVNFFELYAGEKIKAQKLENILDKWIVSKLNLLIKETSEDLESYHIFEAAKRIISFINELSTWYLRRSRDRFKQEDADKQQALQTLKNVLFGLAKILAPFTPFFAERIYQKLGGEKESVHLETWDEFDASLIDEKIMQDMDLARQVVELGLAARDEAQIKVRQPLALLEYSVKNLGEELEQIIADEINVREVRHVREVRANEEVVVKEYTPVAVGLNTKIDESLKLEGTLRELTRQINNLRKEQGLTINDRIKLLYNSSGAELTKLFANEELIEKLKQSTLTTAVEAGEGEHKVKVNDEELLVTLIK